MYCMFEVPKKLDSEAKPAAPKEKSNRPPEPSTETHRPRLFVEEKARDIALQLGHNDPDRVQQFLNDEDR